MISDILMWNKIGRIVSILADRLKVTPLQAMDLFYRSSVCGEIHDPESKLYTFPDAYIADEVLVSAA